ncbi:MAG TPA: hypothetical protein DD441_04600 [Parabacteroides distasonis]|nr:hypothetical protein [Parabacteroides distasonis]
MKKSVDKRNVLFPYRNHIKPFLSRYNLNILLLVLSQFQLVQSYQMKQIRYDQWGFLYEMRKPLQNRYEFPAMDVFHRLVNIMCRLPTYNDHRLIYL